ncbi:MAG: SGNH/GDSL hydrolase family protein [Lachnospiraceae bacterium]
MRNKGFITLRTVVCLGTAALLGTLVPGNALCAISNRIGVMQINAAEIQPKATQHMIQEDYVITPGIRYVTMKEQNTIKQGAGLEYADIGLLQKDQVAIVTGKSSNGWLQIYYIGTIGYIQEELTQTYLGHVRPKEAWRLDLTQTEIRMNVLGDSISYGDKLSSVEQSYAALLGKQLHAVSNLNYGLNGSSLAGIHTDRLLDRYPAMDRNANLILVCGGTNDYGCLGEEGYGTELGRMGDVSDATFYGGLNQLMCGLRQMYPNGEIVFMTPPQRRICVKKNQFGYVLSDYVRAIQEMATFYGIRVINLNGAPELDFAGAKAKYLVDGLHPNKTGHSMIANYIYQELQKYSRGE